MYADLDDLHVKTRDPMVGRLFGESIASFRAGSLRGAIVTLWTAVVFDIVAKLRELELTGDTQAAIQLREFERVREQNDLPSALEFERGILAIARDRFDLLSHQEHDDLSRLHADRHRCAHPSMNSADEPYMPSAELVRYHLNSAGRHLFIRPPVQGMAALDRLFDEVRSPYFPTRTADAARILRGGPLGSAKPSLIRNFVIASLKAPLIGAEASDPGRSRPICVALAGAATFLGSEVSAIIGQVFPRIVQQVSPVSVGRILWLGAFVPEVLDHITDDVAGRIESYIRAMPDEELGPRLVVALGHQRFSVLATERLAGLRYRQLIALVAGNPEGAATRPEIVARVVETYCDSMSWDMSNSLGPQAVAPLSPAIGWDQLQRILEAVAANDELKHAFTTHEVLTRLRDAHPTHADEFVALGHRLGLDQCLSTLFPRAAAAPTDSEDGSEAAS